MKSTGLGTAAAAQSAFYAAFEAGDLEAMRRIWFPGPDAICIHPAGDLLRGHEAILASWRSILSGGGAGKIFFEVSSQSSAGDLTFFTGYEHITPSGSRTAFPPVLATNVYRESGEGWLMLVHHASPIAQPRLVPGSAGATRH